jgi:predicted aspartyl protease
MTNRNPVAAGMLLICAVFLPATAQAVDAPDCRLTLYASLPLTTEVDGRVSVPMTVQDKAYSFMVDTGGAVATIGWDQAEELGLKKKPSGNYLVGVGGRLLSSFITPDHIALGKMVGSDLAFYVESRSGIGIDGTLAPDMLKHYDVDLDFAHGKMNLFSPTHCPGKVVYWTNENYVIIPILASGSAHIRVPVIVDGKEITAVIDTGAVTSIMSLHAADVLGVKEDSPDLKLKSSGGRFKKVKLYTYPFHTLEMGGVTVQNPHIVIGSNEFMGSFRSDMILGMGILRQLHLYISYKEEKLYVSPALAN